MHVQLQLGANHEVQLVGSEVGSLGQTSQRSHRYNIFTPFRIDSQTDARTGQEERRQ